MDDNLKHLHVNIPKKLWAMLKKMSVEKETSMASLVSEFISDGMLKSKEKTLTTKHIELY